MAALVVSPVNAGVMKYETYIYYATEGTDGIWPVNYFRIRLHILHDTACDHDHILRGSSQLLDRQVHHLSKRTLDNEQVRAVRTNTGSILTSLCWNNLVVPKNSVVASWVVKVSPT